VRVSLFLEQFEAVVFDLAAATSYGAIRTDLERKGEVIGWNDLLIAAIAKAAEATLATNNLKEFSRVAGLLIEDWSQTDT
jgi:tRNA(fMet)-specific endonuclease VapC